MVKRTSKIFATQYARASRFGARHRDHSAHGLDRRFREPVVVVDEINVRQAEES